MSSDNKYGKYNKLIEDINKINGGYPSFKELLDLADKSELFTDPAMKPSALSDAYKKPIMVGYAKKAVKKTPVACSCDECAACTGESPLEDSQQEPTVAKFKDLNSKDLSIVLQNFKFNATLSKLLKDIHSLNIFDKYHRINNNMITLGVSKADLSAYAAKKYEVISLNLAVNQDKPIITWHTNIITKHKDEDKISSKIFDFQDMLSILNKDSSKKLIDLHQIFS